MKNYQYILFDLDGTITDPGIGITNSVEYALNKFGITVQGRSELYKFIGPPLLDSFMDYYGFTAEKARQGIAYYREFYSDKGIFQNKVYDGMKDLIRHLKDSGKELIVATSKPEYFAAQIMEHFHLAEYFTFIAGATMDEKRVQKADVIAYALETCGIEDKNRVLMVGDREYDVTGAKTAGIDVMGALFGYGSREELQKAGADYIAGSVEEMKALFFE